VTTVDVETEMVFTVKVACVLPDGMVTDAGTVALDRLLFKLTIIPPVGAALDNVTVPVEELSPTTAVGLNVSDESVGGVTVRIADWETVPTVPVIVADNGVVTTDVFAVNVPLDLPTPMTTDAGMVTDFVPHVRTTVTEAVAGLVRLIVPVLVVPPATVDGLITIDRIVGAVISSGAVFEIVPWVAVMVANPAEEVTIANVADEAPLGTVTDAGV
jgi:hypothetical protein